MTEIIKELKDWGCDTDGALERMANDEDFYIECLVDVVDDPYYEIFEKAFKKGDTATAFDAAHTLKGVLANVGLTPLYNTTVEIVEPLRVGCTDNVAEKFVLLNEQRAKLRSILGKND